MRTDTVPTQAGPEDPNHPAIVHVLDAVETISRELVAVRRRLARLEDVGGLRSRGAAQHILGGR